MKDRWPSFASKERERELVAGRAFDHKNKMPCNNNADQKLSAVATPNWENSRKTATLNAVFVKNAF